MQNNQRLGRVEALSHRQQRILQELMDGDGTCTCGVYISPTAPRFVLCNAVTKSPSGNLDGALLAMAYCLSCSRIINQVLRNLRGSQVKKDDPHSPLDNPESRF